MSEFQPSPPPEAPEVTPIERWITLAILAVIIMGCYFVLRPFLSAILWAFILCTATWPLFARARTVTGGRSGTAALLMTLAISGILLAPFVVAGISLADNAKELIEAGRGYIAEGPPDPPAWVVACRWSATVLRRTGREWRTTPRASWLSSRATSIRSAVSRWRAERQCCRASCS